MIVVIIERWDVAGGYGFTWITRDPSRGPENVFVHCKNINPCPERGTDIGGRTLYVSKIDWSSFPRPKVLESILAPTREEVLRQLIPNWKEVTQ